MKKSTKNRKVDGKIYCFTNKINGKQYVGSTINRLKTRINNHFNLKSSGAPLLVKALKKYGKEGFSVEQIDDAKTIGELNDKEIYWIKKLKSKAPNGYNMIDGGYNNEAAAESNNEPVKCLTTRKIYRSMEEAYKHTGVKPYLIGFNCIGRQDTAGGMNFEYVDSIKRKKGLRTKQIRLNKRLANKTKIRNVKTGEVYFGLTDAQCKTGIHKNTIHNCAIGIMFGYKGIKFEFVDQKKKQKAEKLSKSIKRRGNKNE